MLPVAKLLRRPKLVPKERNPVKIWLVSSFRHSDKKLYLLNVNNSSVLRIVFMRKMSGQVCGKPSGAPIENSTDFTVDTIRVFNAIDEKYLNRHSVEVRLTKRRVSFNRK